MMDFSRISCIFEYEDNHKTLYIFGGFNFVDGPKCNFSRHFNLAVELEMFFELDREIFMQ